jgi:iron complex outermembrane receptor protein
VPGHPDFKASLAYDHTFMFVNGSTLAPRAELVYNSGHYLSQVNIQMADLGQMPYSYQDAYVLGNIGVTWNSSDQRYSISGYVRNVWDEEYKSHVQLNKASNNSIGVTVGDPRTFGVMVNVKF